MTRAFVVGNGKSLRQTPLENLVGEVTFAVNNIHLIYPDTKWRPTHYVRAEEATTLGPEDWRESMDVHFALDCEIWCNEWFARIDRTRSVNIIRPCTHYRLHFDNPECPHLWHLPILCNFGSSVNVAVQLAAQKGYSPIYLVGCDLGYVDGKPNHFNDQYEHGKEQDARFANLDTLYAHMIASRSKAKIYNATIGGELEVYERVEFEELFK